MLNKMCKISESRNPVPNLVSRNKVVVFVKNCFDSHKNGTPG